jgi:GTP-binding protein HflX
MPTCCCMWWMRPTPTFPEQIEQVQRVLAEIGALTSPRFWCSTSSMPLKTHNRPLQLTDMYELDGVAVPRLFVSARSGAGLAALREQLCANWRGAPARTPYPRKTLPLCMRPPPDWAQSGYDKKRDRTE